MLKLTNQVRAWYLFAVSLFLIYSPSLYAKLPDFTDLVEEHSEAVVNISTVSLVESQLPFQFQGNMDQLPDFFRHFFGGPQAPSPNNPSTPKRQSQSMGSGFIVSKEGIILTNNHVVEGADEIYVRFSDRRELKAKLIGSDQRSDLAVLKVEGDNLPVVKLGKSNELKVGEWVFAIGSPFGFDYTVTAGIVSAKGRNLPNENYVPFIQTDVAINPGNSGGPLFNMEGEVVGINTAIVSDRSANVGIGFAIPSNVVRELLPELRGGKVTRGRIGVQIMDVEEESYRDLGLSERIGAIVSSVPEGGPASAAGMQPGDVIVRYNGEPVTNTRDLQNRVVVTRPGTTVPVVVVRAGEEVTLNVTVEELALDNEASVEVAASPDELSEGFGMTLQDLTPQTAASLRVPAGTQGAVVSDVQRGSAAEGSGVQPGDVVLSVNRVDVTNATTAVRELNGVESGRTAFLLVQRGATRVFLQVRKE